MEEMMKVLLVEDEPEAQAAIAAAFAEKSDMRLVGVTNDSAKGTELVYELSPDALILDLELHEGAGNGLLLLQALRNRPPKHLPYILITTNNSSRLTYESARQLGADFILSKHQQGYRDAQSVEFLSMMRPIILSQTANASTANASPAESREDRERHLVQRIHKELDLVGISPKAVGYTYLTEAILLLVDSPSPNVAAQIAKKHGKTGPSVERAMQNAISNAWKRTPIEDLLEHYTAHIRSAKGSPTLSEFIYHYAERIRDEM